MWSSHTENHVRWLSFTHVLTHDWICGKCRTLGNCYDWITPVQKIPANFRTDPNFNLTRDSLSASGPLYTKLKYLQRSLITRSRNLLVLMTMNVSISYSKEPNRNVVPFMGRHLRKSHTSFSYMYNETCGLECNIEKPNTAPCTGPASQ